MCDFCKHFDFGGASASVKDGTPNIYLAGGAYRFPQEEQFRFCPVCGMDRQADTPDREYVIVSNEHSSWPNGTLLFWGRHTENDQARSFGGYTTRFDRCEKYTRAEIEEWRGGLKEQYPFFDEIQPATQRDFKKHNEVVCTMAELESLGWSLWNVVTMA